MELYRLKELVTLSKEYMKEGLSVLDSIKEAEKDMEQIIKEYQYSEAKGIIGGKIPPNAKDFDENIAKWIDIYKTDEKYKLGKIKINAPKDIHFLFRQIDLDNWRKISDKSWLSHELLDKVREEFSEFLTSDSTENEIEEFYDVIQSMLTYLAYRHGDKFIGLLEKGYEEHYKKLEERGHKFK